eukprot:CAMPEP_0170582252 /NCGR_PEP_ID=MMETSP0224-20130122/7482_1 /TAXON_ID=285029 /ORGANISM="Togula jolla, Strain CCCM 725" /LENGTH=202 /DNA_ID=CAMNT_0010905459 /DNA_START=143 /DNA_END=752 /DNA_ORIENTATION=+
MARHRAFIECAEQGLEERKLQADPERALDAAEGGRPNCTSDCTEQGRGARKTIDSRASRVAMSSPTIRLAFEEAAIWRAGPIQREFSSIMRQRSTGVADAVRAAAAAAAWASASASAARMACTPSRALRWALKVSWFNDAFSSRCAARSNMDIEYKPGPTADVRRPGTTSGGGSSYSSEHAPCAAVQRVLAHVGAHAASRGS